MNARDWRSTEPSENDGHSESQSNGQLIPSRGLKRLGPSQGRIRGLRCISVPSMCSRYFTDCGQYCLASSSNIAKLNAHTLALGGAPHMRVFRGRPRRPWKRRLRGPEFSNDHHSPYLRVTANLLRARSSKSSITVELRTPQISSIPQTSLDFKGKFEEYHLHV